MSTSTAGTARATVTACASERICGWQTESTSTADPTLASSTAISAITSVFGDELAPYGTYSI